MLNSKAMDFIVAPSWRLFSIKMFRAAFAISTHFPSKFR
ncbi:hypothetical protein BJ928_12276 [Rhizobium sp. WW_1]|nr:hypothetical protein BJ928_12276 [Rhizobium sp. WW_1]